MNFHFRACEFLAEATMFVKLNDRDEDGLTHAQWWRIVWWLTNSFYIEIARKPGVYDILGVLFTAIVVLVKVWSFASLRYLWHFAIACKLEQEFSGTDTCLRSFLRISRVRLRERLGDTTNSSAINGNRHTNFSGSPAWGLCSFLLLLLLWKEEITPLFFRAQYTVVRFLL